MKRIPALIISAILLSTMAIPVASAKSNEELGPAESAALEAYIDKDIPESDRKKLKEVLSKLDEKHRENVIHINIDGSIISNRSSNLKSLKELNKNKLDRNGNLKINTEELVTKSIDADKEKGKVPALLGTGWKYPDYESENVKTGIYRRAVSNVGYSRLVTDIWLPKKGNGIYITDSSNEKAWAYTGAIDKDGDSIDIDLAYNYNDGPNPWDDVWGMTIHGAKEGTIVTPPEHNFQGGQSIVMDFYVYATNSVALFCAGYNRAGYYVGSTLTAELPWRYDFYGDGSGMKVKRITSIAQVNQNLNSGSEFNHANWTNVRIGQRYNPAQSQDWGLFYGFPRNQILVDYTSQSEEKIWLKAGRLYP
ncbi:hypothetical protein [Paenibacillus elgii]|uniref:hypothetical protein n=1 Tax=Paenibacillus elgii TaxID=189691 RepID=UPI0013D8AB9C|nr:hypothetical protein [Paenibacillus elgii]